MESVKQIPLLIKLRPKNFHNFDESIFNYLKTNIENSYVPEYGFVTEVMGVLSRSEGQIDNSSLEGEINFSIVYEAKVMNVEIGDILVGCVVELVEVAGIFLQYKDFINVTIIQNKLPKEYMNIWKKNDVINVHVDNILQNVADKKISVLGHVHYYKRLGLDVRTVELIKSEGKLDWKTDIKGVDDKKSIENLCDLGYDSRITDIKKLINKVDEDIWIYYRNLLNPLELVYPTNGYTSKSSSGIKVPSRAYFKLWEILNIFTDVGRAGLEDGWETNSYSILSLCEAPGGFVKALMDYRKNKQDKFYVLTLSENKGGLGFNKELMSNKRVNVNPFSSSDICDITVWKKYYEYIKKNVKNGMRITTADGSKGVVDDSYEKEKDNSLLKVAEVIMSILTQAVGGSLIIKMFDLCTAVSVDLLWLLSKYYRSIKIYKPETSRPGNSEKYIICTGFIEKVSANDEKELIKLATDSLKQKYVNGIISVDKKDDDSLTIVKEGIRVFNMRFNRIQLTKLNEILDFINLNNGEKLNELEFKKYYDRQVKIAEGWREQNKLF